MNDSPQMIYNAIERFTARFLNEKKSIFSDDDKEILNKETLDTVCKKITENQDKLGESFDEIIHKQFLEEGDELKELLAHALWLWGIFDYDQKRETKLSNVSDLVKSNLNKDSKIPHTDTDTQLFPDVVIGSAGIYHKTNKYYEICYILKFFQECVGQEPNLAKEKIVSIIKGLGNKYPKNKDHGKKIAMYNILLHLFAPAEYERIASYGHKKKIINFFTNEFKLLATKNQDVIFPDLAEENDDLDGKLQKIRNTICEKVDVFEKYHITKESDTNGKSYLNYIWKDQNLKNKDKFDFYLERVEKLWNSELVLESKNIILHGAPGTGKTYSVESNIKTRLEMLSEEDASEQYCLVQFHPSYGYEDFIDGIKPGGITNGQIQLELVNGQFKELCIKACNNLLASKNDSTKLKNYYFVADEINRAELSRVFGEVLLCLEEDKRLRFDGGKLEGSMLKTMNSSLWTAEHAVVIWDKKNNTPVSPQEYDQNNQSQYDFFFGVPENLYFIGTMNDIDRSVDSFDMALRRRFFWIQTKCDYDVISSKYADSIGYKTICENLNGYIRDKLALGENYQLGHAYFMKIENIDQKNVNWLWKHHLEPLLREYLRSLCNDSEAKTHLEEMKKIFQLSDKK